RSHCSSACLMPSPQLGSLQALVQPSALLRLPSSQASPGPTNPSPHFCRVQLALHALVLPLSGPSSQASTPAHTRPSPQVALLQVRVQAPVLLLLLPLSH